MRHDSYARTILLKAANQSIIKDPTTGAERRILSPVFDGNSLEILRTAIAPKTSLGTYPAHAPGTEEYVLVLKGRLRVQVGAKQQELRQGDSFFFEASYPHELANPGPSTAEIIVVIKH
jgi:quercetin dioxygenase-like cupin family protein